MASPTAESAFSGGVHCGARAYVGRPARKGGPSVKTVHAPPDPALLESMRSIGYTPESAVADVVDNSIAAGATTVDIFVSSNEDFQMSVLDDGSGMSRAEAILAMRLAVVSPTKTRGPDDLGRFGLGLKTASLSQCRMLTVVSRQAGVTTAMRWSLDHVVESGQWELLELDESEVSGLLGWSEFDGLRTGTLVHWGCLDHIKMTEGSNQTDLDRVGMRVREHVALVFHLFNSGDGARRITFRMNGGKIAPMDPFMSASPKIQRTDWEPISVDGEIVKLRAYTLPYLNRLTVKERERLLALGALRETQGFYVYRGGRLVIWGTWFRVMPKSEIAKLTRVRVDIPNSLDYLWSLDVKKSTADPPPAVRARLKELAKTMIEPGRKVQEFRGRKVQGPLRIDYLWNLRENGTEFRYEINSTHPTIESFTQALTIHQRQQFEVVLGDIQDTFPIVDAHNRMSGDRMPVTKIADDAVLDRAATAWAIVKEHGGVSLEVFLKGLTVSEPYCLVPNFERLMKERVEP